MIKNLMIWQLIVTAHGWSVYHEILLFMFANNEFDLRQFDQKKSRTSRKPYYRIRHILLGITTSPASTGKGFLYTSRTPQTLIEQLKTSIIQWHENKRKEFGVRLRQQVAYKRILVISLCWWCHWLCANSRKQLSGLVVRTSFAYDICIWSGSYLSKKRIIYTKQVF